ncbi:ImmA/IrrE family metallo-endopeptidase [Microvirga sp. 2YAF29]|uniref:ImmA/IrrE family metallo-endopeptidase n=1 Tax=Microvirga sp. 2YAF29 TaxID=3233031 RepID=UPI003F9531ED
MTRLTAAEHLLKELGIDNPVDIDLEAIAYYRNATVRIRRLDGCEARILGFRDRAVISVDDRFGPRRARFSLAHELGHWQHHRGRSFVCRPEDIGQKRERNALDPEWVADQYAADLLMPHYLFRTRAQELKRISFETVETLAHEFNVSLTATAIRLIETGLEPAILVCHRGQRRAWFVSGPDVERKWFPKDELDSDSCALTTLYGPSGRSKMRSVPADTWFEGWHAERGNVHEQSVKTAEGQVLSLVVFRDRHLLEKPERSTRLGR